MADGTPARARWALEPLQSRLSLQDGRQAQPEHPADQRRRQRARQSPAPSHAEFLYQYARASRPPYRRVRPVTKTPGSGSNRATNDTVCSWASPPGVNEGTTSKPRIMHHHPDCIWNCRCWADAIIAE